MCLAKFKYEQKFAPNTYFNFSNLLHTHPELVESVAKMMTNLAMVVLYIITRIIRIY